MSKSYVEKAAAFIVTQLAVLLFLIAPVAAQSTSNTTGIIVSPPSLQFNIENGGQVTRTLRVTNQRKERDTFTVSTRQIGIDQYGGYFTPESALSDSRSTFEKQGYISFYPQTFDLEVGQSQDVTVIFDLPANLETSGYYLEIAVMSKVITPGGSPDGNVGAAAEVAIPIGMNYIGSGTQKRLLEVMYFNTVEKSLIPKLETPSGREEYIKTVTSQKKRELWFSFAPIYFTAYVQNKGNVNVSPAGSIFIARDPSFSDPIAEVPLDKDGKFVFSNAGRLIVTQWPGGFIEVDHDGKMKINWNQWNHIRFGKYYAQLNLIWDDVNGKAFKTEVISFWVFPWQLILVIILLAALIVGYFHFKPFGKKKAKSSQNDGTKRKKTTKSK
ncbi:MAG: hypothetical protein QY314_01770 [Candidatus Dojkabacteria bacterium]|nr:MAG: hypothetical protein QY314_01770 [Candidatus Dojkabacteria bacterium]